MKPKNKPLSGLSAGKRMGIAAWMAGVAVFAPALAATARNAGHAAAAGQDTVRAPADTAAAADTTALPESLKTVPGYTAQENDTLDMEFRTLENHAFGVGERLVFDVKYGFVKAGTAVMEIADTTWIHGRPAHHVVTTAESNSFVSTFFKVRDRVETHIDMQGIFPWRFEKHIREGGYKSDRYVEYDQIRNRVVQNQKDTLFVDPYVQGVLSSFYYTRILPLEVGKSFDIDNYGDGKLYPLRVHVHAKQRRTVPAGTFDCIVVEPVMRVEGIFKQTGRLVIWLTDDKYRMPVLMRSKVMIGAIDVELREYRHHDE